jgi:small-conductance mechanosensitive channel
MPTTVILLVVTILVIGGYMILSRRSRRLPSLPLGLLLVYLVLRLVFDLIEDRSWAVVYAKWIDLGCTVILAWAIVRLLFAFLVEFPRKMLKKKDLANITRDFILSICYFVLLFIIIVVQGDINLISIVTTSTALTLVLGLAAQKSLSGLVSGLVLQMENPFTIGDWIKFSNYTGRVTGITWKSTRIVTRDSTLVYIPNAEISNAIVENYSRPERKVVGRMLIGIDYRTPPNNFRQVALDVLAKNPKVLGSPAPQIRVIEFGDFAINYEIYFWHRNYTSEPRLKAEINNHLWYALRRAQINIPFPIRDVRHAHIERRREADKRQKVNQEIASMIESVPFLASLSEEERDRIAQAADIEVFGDREYIVRQGDSGDSMYIILSGECEVLVKPQGGRAMVNRVATIERGDFFGEMSLLTGESRNAAVRALTDTSAAKIDKKTFSEVLAVNPKIFDHIGEVVAKRRQIIDQQTGLRINDTVNTNRLIHMIRSFFGVDDKRDED